MDIDYTSIVVLVLGLAAIAYVIKKRKGDDNKDRKFESGIVGFSVDYLSNLNQAIDQIKKKSKHGAQWDKSIKLIKYNPTQRYKTDNKGNKFAVGGDATLGQGKITLYSEAHSGPVRTGQNAVDFIGLILCIFLERSTGTVISFMLRL